MRAETHAFGSRPGGREQVIRAILEATEQLCACGQPSSFSVKDIAREANVTTSLLYFYFGSKDEIILATLRSLASEIDGAAAETGEAGDMAMAVSGFFVERPAFARIIAWLVLEDRSVTEAMGDHPFLRRLVDTLTTEQTNDPHTQAGAVVTMLLSTGFFHRAVNEALGRRSDDERLVRALDESTAAASRASAKGAGT